MTQDEIIAMARQVGYPIQHPEWQKATEEFAALVAAKATASEREACAKVCEEQSERWAVPVTSDDYRLMWAECAEAIRARGQA